MREAERLAALPVLFFDWDGVCNHGEGFGRGCDVHNLDHLWWIREQTGCRMVCVSARRLTTEGQSRVRLMMGALPRVMVDWLEFLPVASESTWRVTDMEEWMAEAWRDEVKPPRWLVLDDEVHWYEGTWLRPRVMGIDRQVGLTLHEALRAVRVLKGEIEMGEDGQTWEDLL